ncbi:MAG: T9SS type A sorting domain-containing protein [Bacteroidetes bacterium]|nr:T9SS type A sorting domain-containing protein [Bacteroidota bacterium]
MPLLNVTVTSNTTQILVNGSSDPATCGCGPYYMEVEVSQLSNGFTSITPANNSPLWNTYPFYRDSLSVPDYCLVEPYFPVEIAFANLCPGGTYYLRAREHSTGPGGSTGPWTQPISFVVPGSPPPPSAFVASISPGSALICGSGSINLIGTTTGTCNASTINYTWAPAASLSSATGPNVIASPTATTTYTLTCVDATLNYTTTAVVTVTVAPTPTVTVTSTIPSTCNGASGVINVNSAGGTPPYTLVANSGPPPTTYNPPFINLPSGPFTVTLTDATGCTDTEIIILDDSCDYVWPGDANDDGTADNFDILTIGVANGSIGTVRPSASQLWYGQPSPNWATSTPSGVNHKHVDCDGNSFITLNDTNAVILNYGYVHNNRLAAPVYSVNVPDLRIQLVQDTMQPSTAGAMQIRLGTSAIQANNVYGIAFTINFDPTYVDENSLALSLTGSMLGTPNFNIMGVKVLRSGYGQLDVAVTRITQNNISGSGLLCTIPFSTTSALLATGNTMLVPITLSRVRVIDNQENQISVNLINDTLVATDLTITTGTQNNLTETTSLLLVPNPSEGIFSVQFHASMRDNYTLSVYNINGQLVWNEQLNSFSGTTVRLVDLTTEGAGMYVLRLSSPSGEQLSRFIIN